MAVASSPILWWRVLRQGRRPSPSRASWIAATQQGAEATVEAEKRYRLKGRIILERRGSSNNAGAEVCVETTCFTMGDDGTYTLDDLPKSGTVTVSRASYLGSAYAYDGEGGGRMSRSAKGVAQEEITLPDVTLLGGDINQDDIIDIKDAVQAGAARNSTEGDPNWDALADITDDGNVNLLDMVAVQANWNQSAPTPWGGTISEGPGGEPAGLSISDENATTEVAVSPADAAINEPNGSIEVDITVADVTDLYGFTTVLTFDPNKVQVVDANENEGGVQIEVGDLLDANNQFVLVNDVDNQTGTIELSITQVAPAPIQCENTFTRRLISAEESSALYRSICH